MKSTPDTTRTPPKARASPVTTRLLNRSPRVSCQTTIQTSCRHTSAVAEATDVSVSDVTQVAKCTASIAPDSSTSRSSRPVRSRSSARRRTTAAGAIAAVAKALRQNAIASGGTVAAAISGPESDTATTPTAISRSVRTGEQSGTLAW